MAARTGKVMIDINSNYFMLDANEAVQVMTILAGADAYDNDFADTNCQWKPADTSGYRSRVTATVLTPADVAKLALKQD
jgi:hypothetical protein